MSEASALQMLTCLETRGFGWYFAHYGFEGRWLHAKAGLVAMGQSARAELLAEAGKLYDSYISDVFIPAGGEPSAEDDTRYIHAMRVLDKRYRAISAD